MRQRCVLVLFMMLFAATALQAQYLYNPGEKAYDFEGATIDGRTYHLFESPAERIILCFWSVDCDHCHDFLKKLRRCIDLKHDYELVTFALADSIEDVQREVKKLKLPGWHFFDDGGWNGQMFLEYDINTAPTVVLIDKDKNMVGEAYDWDEFRALIKENEKRKMKN